MTCEEYRSKSITKEERKMEDKARKLQKKLGTQKCQRCNAIVEKKEGFVRFVSCEC